jgi:hypothetical protein
VLIEPGNGLLCRRAIGELYEGEASGTTCHPVGRKVDILDVTDFREEALELRFCGFVVQVSNENCVADDCTPFPSCAYLSAARLPGAAIPEAQS